MIKKDSLPSILTVVAFIIIVCIVIFGLLYLLKHLKNIKKEITMNDLKIETIVEGNGNPAKAGDTVVVNYVGTLEDGSEFDNSYKRGQPFPVTIGEGRVIKGWEVGLQGIKIGEKRKLTIPPTMGYGDREVGNGLIPANSVLIFEIEAVEIHPHA